MDLRLCRGQGTMWISTRREDSSRVNKEAGPAVLTGGWEILRPMLWSGWIPDCWHVQHRQERREKWSWTNKRAIRNQTHTFMSIAVFSLVLTAVFLQSEKITVYTDKKASELFGSSTDHVSLSSQSFSWTLQTERQTVGAKKCEQCRWAQCWCKWAIQRPEAVEMKVLDRARNAFTEKIWNTCTNWGLPPLFCHESNLQLDSCPKMCL